jgi:hypothetical protein
MKKTIAFVAALGAALVLFFAEGEAIAQQVQSGVTYPCAANRAACFLRVGGSEYRVENAPQASLGSYGLSNRPGVVETRYSRLDQLSDELTLSPTVVNVEASTVRTAMRLGATVPLTNIPAVVGGEASTGSNYTQHFVVVTWALSAPQAALDHIANRMRRGGTDASPVFAQSFRDPRFRFITSIATVRSFYSQGTDTFTGSLTGTLNAPGLPVGSVRVSLGDDSQLSQTISMGDNTIIGFQSAAVCWENGQPSFPIVAERSIFNRMPANCSDYAHSLRRR